jgi:hypothetical protein
MNIGRALIKESRSHDPAREPTQPVHAAESCPRAVGSQVRLGAWHRARTQRA